MCRVASPHWRAAVAWGALTELPPDDAAKVAAHFARRGAPLPPLISAKDEATTWAEQASVEELAAFAWAAFRCLPRARQDAFIAFVTARAAA